MHDKGLIMIKKGDTIYAREQLGDLTSSQKLEFIGAYRDEGSIFMRVKTRSGPTVAGWLPYRFSRTKLGPGLEDSDVRVSKPPKQPKFKGCTIRD